MIKFITYKIKITTKTALHIWAWNNMIEIWGVDQPIIKDKNWYPYIPGSSLKWKLRSLYEINTFWKKLLDEKWNHIKSFDWKEYDEVSMFFGNSWKNDFKSNKEKEEYIKKLEQLGPTRFIFRDLKLSEESKKELDIIKNKWEKFLDIKVENSIDRKDWIAKDWSLRTIERVFSWITFEWDLIVRLFWLPTLEEEKINLQKFWNNFELENLRELLENDYLWWQWSRWNWQVEIKFILDKESKEYLNNLKNNQIKDVK